ncbi:hypothetical protein BGX27_006236, partial [Mortierella sp. AM989]
MPGKNEDENRSESEEDDAQNDGNYLWSDHSEDDDGGNFEDDEGWSSSENQSDIEDGQDSQVSDERFSDNEGQYSDEDFAGSDRGSDIDEGFSRENDSPEQETDNKDRNTSKVSGNAIFESNPGYKIRTPCPWPNNHQFEDSTIDAELRAWANSVGFMLRIGSRQSGRTKDSDCT